MEITRTDLLTGANVDATGESTLMGGCCGGGSCACGSGDSATPAFDLAGSRGLVDAATRADAAPAPVDGTEFMVTGMTCGHCVSSVREEVGAIDGVESVEVILKKGGASRVTVTLAGPIDADAVRSAVEEAGYQLA